VVSAEDCGRGKPDPECFLTCRQHLNASLEMPLRASECLVVEDSLMGIAAARAAGMRCLAVTTSFPAEQLGDADLAVASLEGIDPWEVAGRL
jgi:beta-phosphoglucomutase-like phosphatase (HAD superfamily)